MTDSYFVLINDLDKDIKVGIPYTLKGEAGIEVDEIEFYVDGFNIGNAGFGRPPASGDYKLWELTYTFNGSGKGRKLVAIAKANGETVCVCNRVFDVAAEEVVKPVGKFPVKIVESKVRHTTQGAMILEGLVVHYTAGRQSTDPSGTIAMANDPDHAPYAFWVMASDGVVYKTHELNRWGYHCATYHHRTHLGIEIQCPGKLTKHEGKFYAWFDLDRSGNPRGPAWPEDQVRYFKGNALQTPGYYAKYTDAQEKALVGLVQFLKDTQPKFSIDNVVGHDCILPDYKDDPGGSLSMDMPAFREYLKRVIV
jgi:N-acetyl-anhydromuramyl-L-alanine amidase AmpD